MIRGSINHEKFKLAMYREILTAIGLVVGGADFCYNKILALKDAAVATASSFSMKNLVRGSYVTAEDGQEGEVIIWKGFSLDGSNGRWACGSRVSNLVFFWSLFWSWIIIINTKNFKLH